MHNFIQDLDTQEILKVSITLFVVIDIIGCIPFILKTKRTSGTIHPSKTTLTVALLGTAFLLCGQKILAIYELDISSFRAAGGIILAILGAEMLFDIEINKTMLQQGAVSSITPLGFPIIGGTGALTTLVLLLEDHKMVNVLIGFMGNLFIVYMVLRYVEWIERVMGYLLITLFTRILGLMLLAMGIQLIKHGFAQG